MKLGDNWFVDAPWAQLLCCTEIPEDKLVKFMAVSNEVLDESHGLGTNEVVPSSWEIPVEKFQKFIERPLRNTQELLLTPTKRGERALLFWIKIMNFH